MKIRNNKTNIEITSPHICKGSFDSKDVYLVDDFEYLFYLEDGWEEVEDEIHFVDEWHDLRKNPNDLPPYYHRVIVTNGPGTDTYATFRIKDNPDRDINDFLRMFETLGPYNNVIAWRELPNFIENETDK